MSETVISVEGLGKRYRIGQKEAYGTLRDSLMRAANPGRWIRRHTAPAAPDEREFWALRDVSFEVKRGEVLGIIGRNGAGKSTLLKILSRITRPTKGRAEVRGRVACLLEVGTGFHAELTGRENVFLNGAILGMGRAEIHRKFDEIVAFAEVDRFIDTPVKRYSSGMYLRLAFAVAAFLEPEILVVDEVLAVGDVEFQRKCLGRMQGVAREGRTVLFVSHNLAAVQQLCTVALLLEKGRVSARGDATNVVRTYLQSSSQEVSGDVDLRGVSRAGPGASEPWLVGLSLNGGLPLRHLEPFSIGLAFEARRNTRDLCFGVGFSTPEGVRILSIDSDLEGSPFAVSKGETGVAHLTLDRLDLQPGRYSLDLGARGSDGRAFDYVGGALYVEVLPGSRTPALLMRFPGGVRLPGQWTLSPVHVTARQSPSSPETEALGAGRRTAGPVTSGAGT